MMAVSNTTTVVAACGIVVLGKWSNDDPIDARVVVGGGALVLGLAFLGEANDTLGRRMAQLVLVVAAFMYVPAIAYKAGLTSIRPPNWGNLRDRAPRKRQNTNPRRPGAGGTARSV